MLLWTREADLNLSKASGVILILTINKDNCWISVRHESERKKLNVGDLFVCVVTVACWDLVSDPPCHITAANDFGVDRKVEQLRG